MTPPDCDTLDWDTLDAHKYRDEAQAVAALLAARPLDASARAAVAADAAGLVRAARGHARRQGVVESFLQEFSLGTKEGLALMCLAEALLRTPDQDTRDKLIAEKIGSADWASHLGQSDSLFVNASTWGLMLTGRLVDVDEAARTDVGGFVRRLAGRLGEPVVRQAVAAAVRIMGEQFVLGRDIEDALKRARREGVLCSFDMLGEGARTAADAERYERLYAEAIDKVGRAAAGAGPERGHGVSVKLSALSPRYEATQEARVWTELYPRLKRLAVLASRHDLNLALDAEEADRLALSLKLLDRLAHEDDLGHWTGLGVVIQAYQTRAVEVVAAVADLARRSRRRIMVRLVKGAYWDSEIKRAQVAGRPGYPVYTTKPATDLSYLVAAKALIGAAPHLYPQFATHNAHTLAAVRHMAGEADVAIEHQRLHGMGEALYAAAGRRYGNDMVLRAYAPVGGHEDLLPYLVRRLLENGANTSFVHSLLDDAVPAERVAADPISAVEASPGPHGKIALPRDIYGPARPNTLGRDLSIKADRERLAGALRALDGERLTAGPIVAGGLRKGVEARDVTSPADLSHVVGRTSEATAEDVDLAFRLARKAQPAWDRAGGPARARVLRATGDALEADLDRLCALLCREGGKSLPDAIAEVREAADFCRYYAVLAEQQFRAPETLKGPVGETNALELRGRGVFACISPWNFPLAHLHRPDRRRAGGRQRRAGQAGRADAPGRRGGGAPVPPRGSGGGVAGAAARARRDGGRRADRPCGAGRGGLHRRHEHRLGHQPHPGGARRPHPALYRRDRRAERHVHRHYGPARAGGGRRDRLRHRLRRPALLGAARAVRAPGQRRHRHRRAEGRAGGAGGRRRRATIQPATSAR